MVAPVMAGKTDQVLRLTGSAVSPRYAKLSAEVAGLVRELTVDQGASIEAGQTLCRIDATFATLALDEAAAQVQRQEAAVAEAERQYSEAERLSREQIVPASELASLRSQSRMAQSALRQAEIAHTRAQEQLQRHELKAPFSGVVISKQTEVGEWIDRGGTAVTVVEVDRLFVEFLVPQGYYNRLDRNREVRLEFDARPGQVLRGRLESVTAFAGEASRSFPVRVLLENSDRTLAPGMSARCQLPLQSAKGGRGLLIPVDAVVRRPDGQTSVWVVKTDAGSNQGRAVRTSVAVSARRGNRVELVSGGLELGQWLVVRGNERLADEQSVRVVERRQAID